MKQLKDATGTGIILNDYICYTVRQGSSMDVHIAKVIGFIFDDSYAYHKYKIKVVSTHLGRKWIDGRYVDGPHFYKTQIYADDTVLVLHPYGINYDIREGINDYIESNGLART